jgi:hypothetical protein
LTDAAELDSEFIDDRVGAALRNCEPYFGSLHLTDQNLPRAQWDSRKVLRFRFNLPGSEQSAPVSAAVASGAASPGPSAAASPKSRADKAEVPPMDQLKNLMKMAVHFIDRAAVTKLSALVTTHCTAHAHHALHIGTFAPTPFSPS